MNERVSHDHIGGCSITQLCEGAGETVEDGYDHSLCAKGTSIESWRSLAVVPFKWHQVNSDVLLRRTPCPDPSGCLLLVV